MSSSLLLTRLKAPWASVCLELLMSGEALCVLVSGPQSLDESTTMGSALGSISASIMEIFRMSETEVFSAAERLELDSGWSLTDASPLLDTGGHWWAPNVIFVTAAPCVMIGCCTWDREPSLIHCQKHNIRAGWIDSEIFWIDSGLSF